MKDLNLCKGIITSNIDGISYKGTMPKLNNKPLSVYVIPTDEFDNIVKKGLELLLSNQSLMPEETFDCFADSLKVTYDDNTERMYYLDRAFYFVNYEDCIWVRYCTMDEFADEGELNC